VVSETRNMDQCFNRRKEMYTSMQKRKNYCNSLRGHRWPGNTSCCKPQRKVCCLIDGLCIFTNKRPASSAQPQSPFDWAGMSSTCQANQFLTWAGFHFADIKEMRVSTTFNNICTNARHPTGSFSMCPFMLLLQGGWHCNFLH